MSDFFDDEKKVTLKDKLNEHLALQECKLEDGTMVSNLDGICDMLIGRALNGDLQVVELIEKIANGKK